MYCKYCGRETDSNHVFCAHCGKRVNPISGVVLSYGHHDVINAFSVLEVSKSGSYLIADLGVGFVILNKKSSY